MMKYVNCKIFGYNNIGTLKILVAEYGLTIGHMLIHNF